MECKSTSNFYIVTFSPLFLKYSQDMEKVEKKWSLDLKCREVADVTKVHCDVRVLEHC